MAKYVCTYCSHVIDDSPSQPLQCPACGHTFPIADDSTFSGVRADSTRIAIPAVPRGEIGRYRIEEELGGGGFGIVFKVYDPALERSVAIKIPRPELLRSPDALERFTREGKSAARLKHPRIVPVLTVEQIGEMPCIVSDFVAGVTLHRRLLDGPAFTFREAAEFVKELADAIAYAHSKKVIHRDIKPKNVIIASEDGKPRLLDFGLARRDVDESITLPNHILGTPGYMSPEQAAGRSAEVDHRTDIYSLGVVLYQLLTGETPFRGDPRMIMRQVVEEEPRAPHELNAEIPPDLETICQKAMEKELKKRYQTATELAEELDRYLQSKPIKARPITRVERSWRWCKRNPVTSMLISSIASLLLLSALGATGMYAQEHRRATEEHRHRTQVEQLVAEKSELLSKSYVERAGRYLGPPTEQPEFSPMKALPWLYAALENDQHDPKRLEAARSRLGIALRQLPSVQRLWSHKRGIKAAAISPTGDRFVTAGHNGTAYVWDVSKDDPVTPALVHPGEVTAIAFTPDGKSVATGCADGGVRLWHAATGKLIRGPLWDAGFGKATSSESAVLFGIDRQSLLALRGPAAQLWNTATGAAIGKTLTVPPGSVCLADSGKLVLSVDANAIVAWDPQTGKEQHRLEEKGRLSPLFAIAPDGVTVALAKTTQSIQLWNCRTNEKLAVTQTNSGSVTALKFSPDGALLASGTDTGTIHLWKSTDGSLVGQQQLSPNRISGIDFSGNARRLAVAAGLHGIVTIVGLDNAEPVPLPIHIPSTIRAAEWLPGKDTLLTFSADGAVRLWETKPRRPAIKLADAAPIRGAAASKDCQTLATIDTEGSCTITQLQNPDTIPKNEPALIATETDKPATVALTSSGSKFAIANSRGALSVWDVPGRKKIRDLDAGVPQARRLTSTDIRLAFTGDDRLLIQVMNRWKERICEISAWDVESGERLRYQKLESDGRLMDFDLQKDGSLCVMAAGRQLALWNALTGQQVGPLILHDNGVKACRLSPDGTRVISGCKDGIARIWNVSTSKVHAASVKQSASIESVALSPDGRRFATACSDGTARIWSAANAFSLTQPLAHGTFVTGCQFSPDSRWLLTTSGDASSSIRCDSILRVWDAMTGEPLLGLPLASLNRGRLGGDSSRIELTWFSSDSQLLHFVIHGGLVETLSLAPDARAASELLRETVLRSGLQPDGTGGVSNLDPESLTRRFRREVPSP